MLIIPIPGSATMRGTVVKTIECAHCGCRFSYRMTRTAKASDFGDAVGAARAKLEHTLNEELDAVPCPDCGRYQAEMIPMLRKQARKDWEEKRFNTKASSVMGFAVIAGVIGMLAAGGSFMHRLFSPFVLACIAISCAGYYYAFANEPDFDHFDPNADASARAHRALPADGDVMRLTP